MFNGSVYTWLVSGGTRFEIGFLIDRLSALMMVVVTFVSLMVHIYTIGYMADDPGYQRFFAYIALFTFAMLMLVMANNFLQLFFGWEAVGLVSYLLIGFWYTRPTRDLRQPQGVPRRTASAISASCSRWRWCSRTSARSTTPRCSRAPRPRRQTTIEVIPGAPWLLLSAICIGLFIGAMGKSAQFPLHVWLPDSMEGPTPISALIHAATMVTAGIFMVARMSPLFELSDTARSMVLDHRRHHRLLHGAHRHGPVRHQARGRVLDAVAARLHDGGAGRVGVLGRDLPPDDARLLQGRCCSSARAR